MRNIPLPDRAKALELNQTALQRIQKLHVKTFPGHPEPVFLISDGYPGVWLEHAYDAIAWADYMPSQAMVARAQVNLFLDNQRPDGQFPCFVLDASNPNSANFGRMMGFGQLQECISFTHLCLDAARQNDDRELLARAYEKCVKWDEWLCANRMTLGRGLVELFCVFDTGHDNSPRLAGIRGGCPDGEAANCNADPALPIIAPDLNAVFYGSRIALAQMARLLDKPEQAAAWETKAAQVKKALYEQCYDKADDFFYDIDREGSPRRFRTVGILNLLCEKLLDREDGRRIYKRYFEDEKEFCTPYPFASMSVSDPHFAKRLGGNDWGYYSQGLTCLRALRWMDDYGLGDELEKLMKIWTQAQITNEIPFSQELDPFTGESTPCVPWYSATMLFYIHSVKRLYNL